MRNKIHSFTSFINEKNNSNLIEFKIPNWALPALINSDSSDLSDEDENKLNAFIKEIVEKYGNANFILGDNEKCDLGFCHSNDIDNLGCDCTMLYLKPSKANESQTESNKHDIDTILNNYFEAALFTEEENLIKDINDNSDNELRNGHFTIYDFTENAKEKSIADIKTFLSKVGSAADDISDEMLGHDIWLSRNSHGAGFFDRGYDKEIVEILMDAARSLKGVDLYVTSDMKIDIM